jgi:hypothetical protein
MDANCASVFPSSLRDGHVKKTDITTEVVGYFLEAPTSFALRATEAGGRTCLPRRVTTIHSASRIFCLPYPFFFAALAPSFPRAVRVALGGCATVLFFFAAAAAFLMFFLAAARFLALIRRVRMCFQDCACARLDLNALRVLQPRHAERATPCVLIVFPILLHAD